MRIASLHTQTATERRRYGTSRTSHVIPSSPSDRPSKPPGEGIGCGGRSSIAVAWRKVEKRQPLLQIVAQLITRWFANDLHVRRLAVRIDAVSELDDSGGFVVSRYAGITREIGDVVIWDVDQLRRHEVGSAFDFIEILIGINPEMRPSVRDNKHHRPGEPGGGYFVVVI